MTSPDAATSRYLAELQEPEDEPLRAARARSEEHDLTTITPEAGSLLRWLTRLLQPRQMVEIGSAGGYTGLWLLGGVAAKTSLTSIEPDPAVRQLALQAYAEAGLAERVRSIEGPALSVLPRLADRGYDLMLLDADPNEYPEFLDHARRMLRPGGLLLAEGVLGGGRVADPAATDPATEALRRFNAAVAEDPALHPHVADVGEGLLAALHQPA